MLKKIAILYGGPNSEREVSFSTKDYFLELYRKLNPVNIEWLEDFTFIVNKKLFEMKDLLNWLKRENIVVIIASHGEYVEDGYLQKLLEESQIKFTGSHSKSCRLSMDKFATYEKVKNICFTVPTYKTTLREFNLETMNNTIGKNFPIFAKPNKLGSSVGAYKIDNFEELKNLLKNKKNVEYLFQTYIRGREVSLGSVRENNDFMKLFPTEIRPKSEFFDYRAKYEKGASQEITPARIAKRKVIELRNLTNKIHQKLGLGFYSRSDFIIDQKGKIYYLETNSLPGMTKTSLLPQQLTYSKKLEDFKKGLLENVIQPV
jgi:D-alanine-D-alanine ligase